MKIDKHLAILLTLAIGALTAFDAAAQSVPSLVNYQGKLTDAGGNPLPNGTYGVAFRLWSKKDNGQPGNTLVWGQEYTNVAVVNGIFNVILGAPGATAVPGAVTNEISAGFNNSERYLGVTVSRSNDGTAIPNPVEIAPRQQVLSTPYSFSAKQATSSAVADRANDVADGIVSITKLAPREIGTSVGVGGVAISSPQSFENVNNDNPTDIPGLEVSIRTTGRPILLLLVGGAAPTAAAIHTYRANGNTAAEFGLKRSGTTIYTYQFQANNLAVDGQIRMPPSCMQFIDTPAAGIYSYKVWVRELNPSSKSGVTNVRLVAYEL